MCLLFISAFIVIDLSLRMLIVLGSKTLGTKCTRTSLYIYYQTMIKTMSLGLDLLKVYLL